MHRSRYTPALLKPWLLKTKRMILWQHLWPTFFSLRFFKYDTTVVDLAGAKAKKKNNSIVPLVCPKMRLVRKQGAKRRLLWVHCGGFPVSASVRWKAHFFFVTFLCFRAHILAFCIGCAHKIISYCTQPSNKDLWNHEDSIAKKKISLEEGEEEATSCGCGRREGQGGGSGGVDRR